MGALAPENANTYGTARQDASGGFKAGRGDKS